MTILVTGGAGFIGSNFVLDWLKTNDIKVINLDKLTYAGNLNNLKDIKGNPNYIFVHGSIGNRELVRNLLNEYKPSAVINFAAESHVDRSIHSPDAFIQTNINETFNLLHESRIYWESLTGAEKDNFRFLHVSTDEVYGTLEPNAPQFTEETPFAPNSPYAASKAASDHLVRAYHHTYKLPTLTTNCSNNYGFYQYPEKLIPLVILNALGRKNLPIYGDGSNIRDWLFVSDHCTAIREVLAKGKLGETYNVGGWNEKTNLEVVHTICDILDELRPHADGSYRQLITFVKDRPGHDRRYAINATKIERELGWKPAETFETGIRKTVEWYLSNPDWIEDIVSGNYKNWVNTNYQGR